MIPRQTGSTRTDTLFPDTTLFRSPEGRTLTGLTLLRQSNALRTALGAYTLDGPYGRLLDAAEQHLAFADVQCFETEALMGQTGVVAPVLTYLFHRLEVRLASRPSLHLLAEDWIFIDTPLFVARILAWLQAQPQNTSLSLFSHNNLPQLPP